MFNLSDYLSGVSRDKFAGNVSNIPVRLELISILLSAGGYCKKKPPVFSQRQVDLLEALGVEVDRRILRLPTRPGLVSAKSNKNAGREKNKTISNEDGVPMATSNQNVGPSTGNIASLRAAMDASAIPSFVKSNKNETILIESDMALAESSHISRPNKVKAIPSKSENEIPENKNENIETMNGVIKDKSKRRWLGRFRRFKWPGFRG
jgi:hypothetical protein